MKNDFRHQQTSSSVREQPPRIAAWILNWLLDDDWETPLGDFEEAFHHMAHEEGYPYARRWYRFQVVRLIPQRVFEKTFWSVVMLRTNLKIAIRSLRKNPGLAAINLGGLAVGMAAFLLIALFIQSELKFDRMYTLSDQIVRVNEITNNADGSERTDGFSRSAVGPAALAQIPEVTNFVRLIGPNFLGRGTVTSQITQFYEGGYYFAEPAFFETFDLPFLHGDPEAALIQPNSVVVTASAAIKYFGTTDAIGQVLQVESMGDYTVTGVLKDLPENTHLSFSLLYSMSSIEADDESKEWLVDWEYRAVPVYLVLTPDATVAQVDAKVKDLYARLAQNPVGVSAVPSLQQLTDIHFGSQYVQSEDNFREGNKSVTWIFGLVAVLIMLIASINYTNIISAGAMKRAKEVGLRKAVGAHKGQLVRQFFGESFVTIFLSVALAFALAQLALPGFNALLGTSLSISFATGVLFFLGLGSGLLLIGMLSSILPALFLSSLSPTAALKGRPDSSSGSPRIRQSLVVAQFTLSIGLIFASLIVVEQMRFLQEKDLGFTEEQLLVVDINSGGVRNNFRTILSEYRAVAGVKEVTVSSRIPGDWKPIREIDMYPSNAGPNAATEAFFIGIEDRFFDTYDMELVAGRNLSMANQADSLSVIINETAAQTLRLAVGDYITVPETSLSRRFQGQIFEPQVVGIVADFNFQSLHQAIQPMVLGFYTNPVQVIDYFTIKLAGAPSPDLMAQLEVIGKKFDPERPWEINFLDARLQDFYKSEAQFKNMFSAATSLAILIACLGLFGLTMFSVIRRTKEIGVRKVMGSSSVAIVGMLSKEIAILVAISFAIAAPISWVIMQNWLANFAFHTSINPLTMFYAGGIALTSALATVSYLSVRASRLNPVQCLRYE